jgi:hypothetical protein
MTTALASLLQLLVAAGSGTRRGGVCGPADGDQYAGLVTDDVHHLGGEQVKLRVTVNQQMPSTPPGLVLRVGPATPAQSEAVLGAAVSGR